MGAAPDMSVVNKRNPCWDEPNMYIVDSSVFATGDAVNPTSGMSALALRAAEHLRDEFADLRRAMRPLAV